MVEFYWVCPFCDRGATIQDKDVLFQEVVLKKAYKNSEGPLKLTCHFIVCPNSKCKRTSISASLNRTSFGSSVGWTTGDLIKEWSLIPQSKAKSYPEYIPQPILDDYNEACLIKDLSPKASATLARRCLQGILRDFWSVTPGKLANEIKQIEDRVESLTWQAIDGVRSVGNIGAHMEKDINIIVDVEANEVELLIGLIETLLKDWYVAREEKKSRLEALIELGADKEASRKPKTT